MKEHHRICKYCRTPFNIPATRQNNAVKYCSDECRQNAKREQNLEAQRRYQKRYRWLLKDRDKWNTLGSSKLGGARDTDFKKEAEKIKNELRRLLKC